MNCPVCGANNTPESKFCAGCGSALPAQEAPAAYVPASQAVPAAPVAPAAPAAPKAKSTVDVKEVTAQLGKTLKPVTDKAKSLFSNKKVRLGAIAGVLALVVVMVLCAVCFGGNGFVERKESITYEYSGEDEISIIVGKKVLKDTIETEEGVESFVSSMDGKVAALLTGEGDLYVIKGSKVKSVAEDATSFELSVTGKGIAYTTYKEGDETISLYWAKVSNAKSEKITGDLGSYSYEISPDGKSVAYFEEGGEDADELMLYKGKKSTSITDDENASLYGLSNNGKQIYVSITEDGDTDLYAFNKKGEKEKLGSLSGSVRFNDDHTQVMFQNDEGKTYISKKGKAGVKASSDPLDLIIAPTSSRMGYTYPVSDLYGHVYQNNDGEAHLIKKNKDIKLVSKASNMQLDASAEYLYYIYDNEELRVIDISKGDSASESAKTIVDDNVSYVVTSDRKYVYYTDDYETLMSVNGKKGGIPKKVADDVDFSSGLALSSKDRVYYVVDDDLYVVSNGKSGKKIQGDIEYVYNTAHGDIYAYNDDNFFASTGSKKLKDILDIDN